MRCLILLAALITVLTGCISDGGQSFYSNPGNWVICETEKSDAEFDVFYVYPTLAGKAKTPEMEWTHISSMATNWASSTRN